ncbi:MAG TPA: methyltransferase domain-containing protein [Longimicrobium sp.]|jgi:ubiquinone/menaquinone biosynthesis C-methylase UbiE|uniref:class I SAM-dependent methyltransferase n=1 Tax=Longimicrobium sp. TaxID=2029185 RepID=UPI002ED898B2
MAEASSRPYVPAAGKHWRLPLYDLMAKVLGADAARRVLVQQIACRSGDRVLEIGCGTGSLLLAVKQAQPGAEVVGLDPDPAALAIARRKAERAGVPIRTDQGYADELPYADASFDRILSSFMFHHLPRAVKEAALREAPRVLKPGGRFHMVDFGGPGSGRRGFIGHLIHADRHLKDNAEDRVLALMGRAGLADAQVLARRPSPLGSAVYYQATVPPA